MVYYSCKVIEGGNPMACNIGFVARKGGVGKTTSCLAIGAGLAKREKKVLYVDLDSQVNLTITMQAKTQGINILGLLLKQVENPMDAIQHTEMGDIIAATPELNGIDAVVKGMGREYRLREEMEPLQDKYDYILYDTPPALELPTVMALTCCNQIIVPVLPDLYSIEGIRQLWDAVTNTRKYTNRNLQVAGFIVNHYNARTNIGKMLRGDLETMAAKLGTKVFRTEIRECTAIKEAQLMYQSIYQYAPKANAVADFDSIVDELLEG